MKCNSDEVFSIRTNIRCLFRSTEVSRDMFQCFIYWHDQTELSFFLSCISSVKMQQRTSCFETFYTSLILHGHSQPVLSVCPCRKNKVLADWLKAFRLCLYLCPTAHNSDITTDNKFCIILRKCLKATCPNKSKPSFSSQWSYSVLIR